MKRFNYETGKKGEKIARRFLRKKRYKVLESNFNTRFGEIDLICTKDGKLVFVEVKLKIGDTYGSPEEMITPKKVEQVQKTAQAFLQKNPRISKKYQSFQIDAVTIVLGKNGEISRINHYENISF